MDRQLAEPVTGNYRAFVAGERMPTEFEPSRGCGFETYREADIPRM